MVPCTSPRCTCKGTSRDWASVSLVLRETCGRANCRYSVEVNSGNVLGHDGAYIEPPLPLKISCSMALFHKPWVAAHAAGGLAFDVFLVLMLLDIDILKWHSRGVSIVPISIYTHTYIHTYHVQILICLFIPVLVGLSIPPFWVKVLGAVVLELPWLHIRPRCHDTACHTSESLIISAVRCPPMIAGLLAPQNTGHSHEFARLCQVLWRFSLWS